MRKALQISFETGGVAVAVRARTRGMWNFLARAARRKYSGRKLCPHSEIQWASSMASRLIFARLIFATKVSLTKRSGAT